MSDLNVTPITNDSFNTTILEDGTIQLDGLNFDVSGEFVIPSSLKGKIVSKIGENAFSNNNGITQIIVPPTITSISDGLVNLNKLVNFLPLILADVLVLLILPLVTPVV